MVKSYISITIYGIRVDKPLTSNKLIIDMIILWKNSRFLEIKTKTLIANVAANKQSNNIDITSFQNQLIRVQQFPMEVEIW